MTRNGRYGPGQGGGAGSLLSSQPRPPRYAIHLEPTHASDTTIMAPAAYDRSSNGNAASKIGKTGNGNNPAYISTAEVIRLEHEYGAHK